MDAAAGLVAAGLVEDVAPCRAGPKAFSRIAANCFRFASSVFDNLRDDNVFSKSFEMSGFDAGIGLLCRDNREED